MERFANFEAFPISVAGSGRNRAGKQKGNGESEARRGGAERNGNTGRAERAWKAARRRRKQEAKQGVTRLARFLRLPSVQLGGPSSRVDRTHVHDFPRVEY